MPPLPSVSRIKLARVNGSHHIMRHPDRRGTTVPVHGNRV